MLSTSVISAAIRLFPLDRCPGACCFSPAGSLRFHILSSSTYKILEFRQFSLTENGGIQRKPLAVFYQLPNKQKAFPLHRQEHSLQPMEISVVGIGPL